MKKFPTLCVDNFYDDPNSVREFALQQEYIEDINGQWPGKRSKQLHEIDRNFFNDTCFKFFSSRFDLTKNIMNWQVSCGFQIIEPLHIDKNSPKNIGWIHRDDDFIFSGIVFLNSEIDSDCGTSIFELTDDVNICRDNTKVDFYKYKIDKNYDETLLKHNACFKETIRFQNLYNRMISFDANIWHGANNFYSSNEPRLTLVFFVKSYEILT